MIVERLRVALGELRASLWLVPSLVVAACVVSAIVLVDTDARLDPGALEPWPRLFGAGAEGAHGVLATIAGSMMTVAGVVFSITLAALSQTASQYSSRVLRNFMRDRRNQFALGVFVGIFAYCLVVLRAIRSPDEGDFVPSLAVLGGVLLAFVGIAVLIAFIHHVANSLQASQILADVSEETERAMERLFPEALGHDEDDVVEADASHEPGAGRWREIAAERSGYLQTLESGRLVDLAREHDVVVRIEAMIGDFVVAGAPVLAVNAPGAIDDELCNALREVVIVGRQRTLDNDAAFGLRQIVDVALRALSPGINDVTTAVMGIDYLAALFLRLAGRRFPSPYRRVDGVLRVIAPAPSFGMLFAGVFEELRLAAGAQPRVQQRLASLVRTVARGARARGRRAALVAAAEALLAQARDLPDDRARMRVVADVEALLAELRPATPCNA